MLESFQDEDLKQKNDVMNIRILFRIQMTFCFIDFYQKSIYHLEKVKGNPIEYIIVI